MKFLTRLFAVLLVVLILGILEARIGFGEDIYSAGQTTADPVPFYKGA